MLTSYRNDAKQYLDAELGADMPLRRVTEAKVEGMQSALLVPPGPVGGVRLRVPG